MQYKKLQRSPHYGRIYGYNEKGQKIEELNWIELEVEHEGQTYTVADLLKKQVDNELTMKALLASNQKLAAKDKELGRTITQLESKIETLTEILTKLTTEVSKLRKANKGL